MNRGFFDELREFAVDYGRKVGEEEMKPFFEEAQLADRLGSLHVGLPMHSAEGREIKTQECFVRSPAYDGKGGNLLLNPESFESEVVYIHVVRMIAMAIDPQFQAKVSRAATELGGSYRGVPTKNVARMWNKLLAKDDHRHLTAAQKADGMTRRSGQNIDINRCAATFKADDVESLKVRRWGCCCPRQIRCRCAA